MRDGAVDDALDAGFFQYRHAFHSAAQPGHQAIQVVGKQFAVGVPVGKPPRRPGLGHADMLINADQAGLLLLADISRGVRVADDGDFFIAVHEFGHRPGNDVMVFHIRDRQISADHLRHPAGEAACRIDHHFGNHRAFFGRHLPLPRRQGLNIGDAIMAHYSRTHVFRAPRHGVAQAGGIGMAVIQGPGPGQYAVGIHERIDFANFIGSDDLHAETDIPGDTTHKSEPVQVILCPGEPDAA